MGVLAGRGKEHGVVGCRCVVWGCCVDVGVSVGQGVGLCSLVVVHHGGFGGGVVIVVLCLFGLGLRVFRRGLCATS